MQGSKYKPVIDERSCLGCGICAENCPSNAIRVKDKAEINYARCTACYECERVCPQNAISLAPPSSSEASSPEKRLHSLRKRAEKLGERLIEIEQGLRKMTEASSS